MTCVQTFRAGFYVVFVVITLLHLIFVSICEIIEFVVMIVSLGNTLWVCPFLSPPLPPLFLPLFTLG